MESQTNTKLQTTKTKQANQAITKYHHYINTLFPTLFTKNEDSSKINLKSINSSNNISYLWGQLIVGQVRDPTPQGFLAAFVKLYLDQNVLKVGSSFLKKTVYSSSYFHNYEITQMLQVVIENMIQNVQKNNLESNMNFNAYILHYSEKNNYLKWNHFIQKYQFRNNKLRYDIVCSINDDGYFKKHASYTKKLIQSYYNQSNINKLVGLILQFGNKKQLFNDNKDVAYQQCHRRILKLPSQHYTSFLKIKEKLPQEVNQNTICRFMIANDYKVGESLDSIRRYYDWHRKMTQKYSLQSFINLIEFDIFTYLGQDYQGRPVVLNKAANVRVNELDDDQYCDFYLYWLQIYLGTKFRGYVDQFVIITDLQNLSIANFKLSLTKRNLSQVLMYCPQRQLKIFAVNANSFGWYCWQVFKKILPEKTLKKLIIAGNSQEEILTFLKKEMSENVIPIHLGGKNPLGGKPK